MKNYIDIPYSLPANDVTQDTFDSEFEAKIARYLELKEQVKEYNKLHKEIKEFFKDVPEAFVGRYKVTGERVYRDGYEVKPFNYWNMKINEIK